MTFIRIGFTGTRDGMTYQQSDRVREILKEHFWAGCEFHHGDCIGADSQACDIARHIGYVIHSHPPINESQRAFKLCDVSYPTSPFLTRNHRIVDKTDLLIACPKEAEEQLRSGTWATIRYAKKKRRWLNIILPDGKIVFHNDRTTLTGVKR